MSKESVKVIFMIWGVIISTIITGIVFDPSARLGWGLLSGAIAGGWVLVILITMQRVRKEHHEQ
jgi:predicted membrane protein